MKGSQKRNTGVLLAVIGVIVLVNVCWKIYNDLDVDLSKAKQQTGIVEIAEERKIKMFTIRFQKYKRVFYFQLENSPEKFTIYRNAQVYDSYNHSIKKGDTIKVYYRPSSYDYNENVFQVEKGTNIISNYNNFETELSAKTGLFLLISIILLVCGIMLITSFNLLKFLKYLAEGKQK
jgi:hypothetical protein